ncbi:MAG: methyl-accepting chemotaxis protein [Alphaproteobacteria bacterium]|nr:methyl-accepting chemotaxis protein [Alphaproteobacteria bacterium]
MKIGTKIIALVSGMMIALLAVGGISIYLMKEIGTELHEIAKEDIPLSNHVTEVALNQLEQAVIFERTVRLAQNLSKDPSEAKHVAELIARFRAIGQKANKEFKVAERIAKQGASVAATAEARAKFKTFLAELESLDHAHAAYERHALELLARLSKSELKNAKALIAKVEAEEEAIDRKVEALVRKIEAFTKQSIENASAHEETALFIVLVLTGVVLVLSMLASFVIVRGITKPLRAIVAAMGSLAKGETNIEIKGRERADEVGEIAQATEVFRENAIEKERLEAEQAERARQAEVEKRETMNKLADSFEGSVGGVIDTVSSSTTEMRASAESMTTTAENASQQATAVAAASEEATVNVQTVAAAAEEMSNSVTEISRQVARSTEISARAVEEAEKTNATVEGLSEAAQKVGEVVQLISEIAEKTNLLALNATIESARAGEAGKGFAVVANEVKSLAEQTGKATEEIGAQITAIQNETGSAVEAIKGIGATIEEVAEIATSIASAVEEQSAATQEIARNCQEAAKGTSEVSGTITQVNQAANDTGAAAGQVLSAATELSSMSEGLRKTVDEFLQTVRAA